MTARYELSPRLLENGLRNLIFNSLGHLIQNHPALGVTVSGSSPAPSWARLTQINLETIVRFTEAGSDSTTSIIEAAHRVPFENGLPLWRVIIIELGDVRESSFIEVALFIHHALGDGQSGLAFHKDFQEALTTIDCTKSKSVVDVPKLPLLPPLEEAHHLPLSFFYIVRQIFNIFFSSEDDQHWTGPLIRADNNITHLRTIFFPDTQVAQILQLCRSNNVTMTALVTVIIANILAQTYPDCNQFTCGSAMSFRRFTGTPNNAIVNYVSSYDHRFSTVSKPGYIDCSKFTWDAVRACHAEIKSATASAKDQRVGLLRYANDYIGYFRKQIGKKRSFSFEVSNVGVLDSGNDPALIKRVIFSQSSNVIGPAYVFSLATAKGGDMAIALTWQEDILEKETAEKTFQRIGDEIQKLISDSTP